jgi:preprotein translocase subunit Sec61beta
MASSDPIRTPSSMAGIMGFYDSSGGGVSLDPRSVFVFTIFFIVAVKIGSLLVK